LSGLAIALGPASEGVLVLEDLADFPEQSNLGVFAACLPLDQWELDRFERLLHDSKSIPYPLLLTRDPKKGSQDRIYRALQFWSDAELRRDEMEGLHTSPWSLADLFLRYCIVLEVLLASGHGVTEAIATRAAAIHVDDPEERLSIAAKVRGLYDKRSRYVHAGEIAIQASDVREMRETVRPCLGYAVRWLGERASAISVEEPVTEDNVEKILDMMFGSDDFAQHCDRLRFGGRRIDPFQSTPSDQ
jgi:hypothetical protein